MRYVFNFLLALVSMTDQSILFTAILYLKYIIRRHKLEKNDLKKGGSTQSTQVYCALQTNLKQVLVHKIPIQKRMIPYKRVIKFEYEKRDIKRER